MHKTHIDKGSHHLKNETYGARGADRHCLKIHNISYVKASLSRPAKYYCLLFQFHWKLLKLDVSPGRLSAHLLSLSSKDFQHGHDDAMISLYQWPMISDQRGRISDQWSVYISSSVLLALNMPSARLSAGFSSQQAGRSPQKAVKLPKRWGQVCL